jgi:hypothetical protein
MKLIKIEWKPQKIERSKNGDSFSQNLMIQLTMNQEGIAYAQQLKTNLATRCHLQCLSRHVTNNNNNWKKKIITTKSIKGTSHFDGWTNLPNSSITSIRLWKERLIWKWRTRNQLQFTLISSSLNAFQRWAASALLLLSTIFAQF